MEGDPSDVSLVVSLETRTDIQQTCSANAVACAVSPSLNTAVIYIPDDFDTSEYMYPRSVIVHDFLHALGLWGHVNSIDFPDSIMGTSGEYIPNLGYIISKIDREALQVIYMGQRPDLYSNLGRWTDTSFHLMGKANDDTMRFGVALFNGLPHPWARGIFPNTDLASNTSLSGTATWNGTLLGYSGPSPIAGDATNEQNLQFQDIFFVNRFESTGDDRWFHTRNIDYKVTVSGNVFLNVQGEGREQGRVIGAFMGARHEHMGGTVKRTDMVAAFGGKR